MLWIYLDTFILFWIFILSIVGGMSQPDLFTLLDTSFVVLLGVGMGGISIGVGLCIGIS